jgi:prefoldin subunit 5
MNKGRKSQSYLQYAVLIAVMVAVFLSMRIFMVRSVQEKYRQSADVLGEGAQYAKGETRATDTSTSSSLITPPVPITDPCPNLVNAVSDLERQRDSLLSQATDLRITANKIEAQITDIPATANTLRSHAASLRRRANQTDAQAQGYRNSAEDYRRCDPNYSNCNYSIDRKFYYDPELKECLSLGNYADVYDCGAAKLDNRAKTLRDNANSIESDAAKLDAQVPDLQAQVRILREQAATLETSANNKQTQIDQYKTARPECFS